MIHRTALFRLRWRGACTALLQSHTSPTQRWREGRDGLDGQEAEERSRLRQRSTRWSAIGLWLVFASGCSVIGCQPVIQSTLSGPPLPAQLAELWVEPGRDRNLYWGVGGRRLAPDAATRYTVIEVKRGGFSRGYTVVDPDGREWSAKFPPEAPTEVAASRILWGVGYHQPPIYYLPEWQADRAPAPNPQLPARFREKKPELHGLDAGPSWSYYRNPFVGARPLNGLLVLHAMLGNSDLKDDQNVIYSLDDPPDGITRWYVARDLGQTFGRTGLFDPPRGDIDIFEQTPFIRGVENGYVRFHYRGRHRALFDHITPADVRWICERLAALSDTQLQDAFRAAGYPRPTADRFIARLKQKIDEGLQVGG
jgi:hypothetical protein